MVQEENKLHKKFSDAIAKIGIKSTGFPIPVFYSAPCGIRFEIGGDEDVYLPNDNGANPSYINNALIRAMELYNSLPYKPNILRIDIYPDEETTCQGATLQALMQMGLPFPDERVKEEMHEEMDVCLQEHLYWDLLKCKLQVNTLLMEIIKGDLGGLIALTSNVYFINTEQNIMFHLYDDRGADIVSESKKDLLSLYRKYNDWILDYDRAQIDCLFK